MIIGKTENFGNKYRKRVKYLIEHAFDGLKVNVFVSRESGMVFVDTLNLDEVSEKIRDTVEKRFSLQFLTDFTHALLFTLEHVAIELGHDFED